MERLDLLKNAMSEIVVKYQEAFRDKGNYKDIFILKANSELKGVLIAAQWLGVDAEELAELQVKKDTLLGNFAAITTHIH
jgi:hypothetical protein